MIPSGASQRAASASAFGVVCALLLARPAAGQITTPSPITCYNCTMESGTDNPCSGANPSLMPTLPNCGSCRVTSSTNSGGVLTFTRDCWPVFVTTRCAGTTCFCNTPNCNKQTFTTQTSVECYECNSASYIDNGCGKTLDPASPFVNKQKGCTACELSISEENDGSGYTRRCLYDVPDSNTCAYKEDSAGQGCTHRCTSDLCNSANQLRAFSSLGLSLAIVIAAIFNKLA